MHLTLLNDNRPLWPAFERIEHLAIIDLFRAATPETIEKFGLSCDTSGLVVTAMATGIDELIVNRVNGLGEDSPATIDTIDRIIDQYRAAGVRRFCIQVPSFAEPNDLPRMLSDRGFTHPSDCPKLIRDTNAPISVETDLTIEQIDRRDTEGFGDILSASFNWPNVLGTWMAQTIGCRNWAHYVARDGEQIVATAATFYHGDCAWLDFAGTLESHRRCGAQSVLLARRIKDAAARYDCRWLVTETVSKPDEAEEQSYRNLKRFGFQVAYVRGNYVWEQQLE